MNTIVFKGALTLDKLKELAAKHYLAAPKDRKIFLIAEQEDGNFVGRTEKDGQEVMSRAGDPYTALTELLTHPGV